MKICQGSDKMASIASPTEPFHARMAHNRVGAATQMTGLLRGVTNGTLDSQYMYIICRVKPTGMQSAV